VGEGLQDHPAVTVAFDSAIKDGMTEIKPWMPRVNVLSPWALYLWAVRGSGILSTTFCDHGAFVRSRPEVDREKPAAGRRGKGRAVAAGQHGKDGAVANLPDVQLRFVPGIGPAPDGVKAYELLGKGIQHANYGFTLQVINCRPKSSGAVRISSADPAVAPTIRCNYLAEPCDALALAQGIALARRLATSGALGEISLGEVYPGAHVQSAAEVETYIRRTLHSANGLSGGCCIGAVVDSVLRVHGVHGLRVADASVMPSIPGAQLALPTTMIAERAAKLIRKAEDASLVASGGSKAAMMQRRRASRSPTRRR